MKLRQVYRLENRHLGNYAYICLESVVTLISVNALQIMATKPVVVCTGQGGGKTW